MSNKIVTLSLPEVVLIDTFIVPTENKSALVEKAMESAKFLRTVTGFIEGYIFEKITGNGTFNVVTTAVWRDEAAFENAKRVAAEEFKRIGFNSQEIMANLNVTMQRAIYKRVAY